MVDVSCGDSFTVVIAWEDTIMQKQETVVTEPDEDNSGEGLVVLRNESVMSKTQQNQATYF